MNILHDKSSVKSSSAKWIDRGYAREDVHSLRLQYVYTPEQREANRQICDDGPDEAHRRIKRAAESKNAVMASVMAAIAREFICYQYESEDPAPYGSSRWELFFWCNDFSNTLHGYGLSGRDYSYFTLSFNLAQTVEQRAAVCGRVLQFLETRFHLLNYNTIKVLLHKKAHHAHPNVTPQKCTMREMVVEESYMEMDFIRNRITELRVKKGISEYQLSYDLGHSKNYIHNIVTGYSQPSVKELLYLIDTLGITPRLFFDEETEYRNPILVQEIIDGIKSMNDQDLEAVLLMVRRLNEKN